MDGKVLVVGAGPVGLILAIQLARYGVAVDIIDKGTGGSSYSKALSVSAASLKAFHGLGLSKEIHVAGKPIRDIQIYFNERRNARIDKRRLKGLYDYYLSLAQPETESVLKNSLQDLGVAVRYRTELKSFIDHTSHVTAQSVDVAEGCSTLTDYDYVVGCDGAQSTVRKLSGIDFDGYDYQTHFVMGDVLFDSPDRGDATSYHVHDDAFLIFLPMPAGLTRLVVSRPGPLPEHRALPDKAELQVYLDRYHGAGLKIETVHWSSSARFFNRLANTNHKGRIFLAGDSFHLFSPIGGQGMNTGIQDAMNLSWKLAFYMRGLCDVTLLDSYREERYIAVNKVAALSENNTQAILRRAEAEAFEVRYMPKMSNRRFFRQALAQDFSGLTLDHGQDAASLAGKHVPYLCWTSADSIAVDTYSVPLVCKNIIFLSPDAPRKEANALMASFSDVLTTQWLSPNDLDAIESLDLHKYEACLVRPDGYIGFSGSVDHCARYIDRYYSRRDALDHLSVNQ